VVVLFVIAGVVLLILAGLNVRAPRFAPEFFGYACLAVALFTGALAKLWT
jgi:hypothetical protein